MNTLTFKKSVTDEIIDEFANRMELILDDYKHLTYNKGAFSKDEYDKLQDEIGKQMENIRKELNQLMK